MEFYVRSDLACESAGPEERAGAGAEWTEHRSGAFRVLRLTVKTPEAARRIGKPTGTYVTVECGGRRWADRGDAELLSRLISGEIRGMAERLTGRTPDADFGVFVAGLGNASLTADAIGPRTVAKISATRHLREEANAVYRSVGCSALSALSPGVLGQTGIETLELIRGAVRYVCPNLVIVVDALAARSCDRLAATVQISDAGIEPGSGVGNHRSAITRSTVGVPVIVLGVPTVVDSATLVYDALREAGLDAEDERLRRVLENGRSFFVSPNECDVITERFSRVLADAISVTFTGGLSLLPE